MARGSSRWRRRNASGSAWARSASSSMKQSCANELGRADTPRSQAARMMAAVSWHTTRSLS
ncbi:Uncharacterised protein [Bordetella pertussis]|nr:Uncharacterised protein [Bordetella pertussis]